MAINIKAYANSDKGMKYETNEDAVLAYVRPAELGAPLAFIMVADGIGGHSAGEIASELAIETIQASMQHVLETDEQEVTQPINLENGEDEEDPFALYVENKLRSAIHNANTVIFEYAGSHPDNAGNLGSTITCAIVAQHLAVIANVGDSRTYHLRGGDFTRITEDHSYVAELVNRGAVEEDAYYTHPQRNVITRALGHRANVDIDIYRQALQPGDRLMCCSDGLWEMIIDAKELTKLLSQRAGLDEITEELIEKANFYGGKDNIGVALAELSKD